MGWDKRPTAFKNDIIKAVSTKMRSDALCILGNVTSASPVDTGRFKGNWLVGIGFPDGRVLDTVDKSGAVTMSAASSVLRNHKQYQDIWISNNLPYAAPLNNGHSQKAPANFVQAAVLRCAK